MSSKPGSVFKRVETDDEFRARLRLADIHVAEWHTGAALDRFAWDNFKRQRRIVEDAR